MEIRFTVSTEDIQKYDYLVLAAMGQALKQAKAFVLETYAEENKQVQEHIDTDPLKIIGNVREMQKAFLDKVQDSMQDILADQLSYIAYGSEVINQDGLENIEYLMKELYRLSVEAIQGVVKDPGYTLVPHYLKKITEVDENTKSA